jgi:glycosyltransferase involved in cell wall biosynthesis
MKILFISMPSIHAIRWIENLKDTSYELYWFDVMGRGNMWTINRVHQFTDWERRKLPYLKGEYFLSRNYPSFFEKIEPFLKVTASEQLATIIKTIQPDIIHSFEMQSCSYPIIKAMNRFPNIKWIYSCWGNDLYYYRQFSFHLKRIKIVLARVNAIHTDCARDYTIAKKLGFKGFHLGVVPGGSGYNLDLYHSLKLPVTQRKMIIVKGYQHQFGKGLIIVKALHAIQSELQNFEIVVFGAHKEVVEYINDNKLPYQVYHRHELSHDEILTLMGKSVIYIGNSISDGIPNTMLEAVAMGAFPIQSNPGGATEEIINHGKNGLLIENPESIEEIIQLLRFAISNPEMIENAIKINTILAQEKLEYKMVKEKIVAMYENCNVF